MQLQKKLKGRDLLATSSTQGGSLLVEILLAVGLLGIASMTFAGLYVQSSELIQSIPLHNLAQQITYNTKTILDSPGAWEASLQDSTHANFSCLGQNVTCQGRLPFNLLRADGSVWIDSLDPNAGFTAKGEACNQFTYQRTNPDCPIRAEVYWEPVCTGAACQGSSLTQAKISFELIISPATPPSGGSQTPSRSAPQALRNAPLNPMYYNFLSYKPIQAPPSGGGGPMRTFAGSYYIPRAAMTPDGQSFVVVSGINSYFTPSTGHVDGSAEAHFFNEDFSRFNTVQLTVSPGILGSGPITRATALDNNHFAVVWETSISSGVGARVFDTDGNPITSDLTVCPESPGPNCFDPHVAGFDGGNRFVVIYRKSGGQNIYFRYYDSTGTALGGGEEVFPIPGPPGTAFVGVAETNGSWPVVVIYSVNNITYRLLPPGVLGGPSTQLLLNNYTRGWHDTDTVTSSHDKSRIYLMDEPRNAGILVYDTSFNLTGAHYFPTVDLRSWPGVFPIAKAGLEKSALHSVSFDYYLGVEPTPGKRVIEVPERAAPSSVFISLSALPPIPMQIFKVIGGPNQAIITGVDVSSPSTDHRDLIILSQPYEQ